jgi:hypothetical protein
MNAFDLAKKKYEKNQERAARSASNAERLPEKKEEPKQVVINKGPGPMVVSISGPVSLTLEVHYSGTLISSQSSPEAMKALLKKQLSSLGRVVECP